MTRRRWIQDRETGELIEAELYVPRGTESPMVMPDIQPYKSMVTGEMVNSRSRHRAMLREHNLIEIGNETNYLHSKKPSTPPGLKEEIVKAFKKHRGY